MTKILLEVARSLMLSAYVLEQFSVETVLTTYRIEHLPSHVLNFRTQCQELLATILIIESYQILQSGSSVAQLLSTSTSITVNVTQIYQMSSPKLLLVSERL